jgi:mono/diheme cytochrome c family protein
MTRWPLLVFAGALSCFAADPKLIESGRYLVEEVAKCQTCHTPRLDNGQFDKEKWLKGAVLDFQPIKEVKGWHKTSPDLTATSRLWSRWGEATMLKYLMTGLGPKDTPADPPMPAYKFKQADAEAILEYLKSLK